MVSRSMKECKQEPFKEAPVRYAMERLVLRLCFLMLAIFFTLFLAPQIWHLFSPFLLALPIAAFLQPFIRFFENRMHIRRNFAVAFWVLLICSAALLLLYWFSSFIIVQIINAANNAPSIVSSIIGVLQAASDRLLNAAQNLPDVIGQTIRDSLNGVFKSLSETGMNLASMLISSTFTIASRLPFVFIYANFFLLGIFFLAGRYPRIQAWLQRFSGNTKEAQITILRKSAIRGMIGYIRVQLLFFMIVLLLSWLYFQAVGFEYALLIGVIAALLELIPQFGCGTLYIPWSILSFIIGSNRNGWLILGLYLGYTLLRRLAEPMILGTNLGVSPLLSLIGMFVGMQVAGIVGLILGPIAMVVLVSAVHGKLFSNSVADLRTLALYLKKRWLRGREGIPLEP